VPDGDLFDFSNSVGKIVRFYLYQPGVGQRLPNSLTPAFFAHKSVPQSDILANLSAQLYQLFC
jgi:hypothetical protein